MTCRLYAQIFLILLQFVSSETPFFCGKVLFFFSFVLIWFRISIQYTCEPCLCLNPFFLFSACCVIFGKFKFTRASPFLIAATSKAIAAFLFVSNDPRQICFLSTLIFAEYFFAEYLYTPMNPVLFVYSNLQSTLIIIIKSNVRFI